VAGTVWILASQPHERDTVALDYAQAGRGNYPEVAEGQQRWSPAARGAEGYARITLQNAAAALNSIWG
jgi:hypothetical protein